jgi:hypothetical protein
VSLNKIELSVSVNNAKSVAIAIALDPLAEISAVMGRSARHLML